MQRSKGACSEQEDSSSSSQSRKMASHYLEMKTLSMRSKVG
jgi:hypothetical protein